MAVTIPVAIAIFVAISLRVAPAAVSAIAMVLASRVCLVLSGLVDGRHVVFVRDVGAMMC